MAKVGNINQLTVVKLVEFGAYLDGGPLGEILLPKRYLKADLQPGDTVEVFIYYDSQDRLVATTEKPLAQLGEVAYLKVKDVNRTGAFLDWGMPKDLLVPYAEQRVPMEVGKRYCVYLYIDKSGRIAASSKLSLHIPETNKNFKSGQAVDLMVVSRSQMGYSALINGSHLGLIHHNDLVKSLRIGQPLKGFIKGIRPDRKINLTLQKPGKDAPEELAEQILAYLEANNGVSELTDKATPEQIFAQFRVSKAQYKRTLGRLLKLGKIELTKQQLSLK